jgi:hypothetical protein
LGQRIAHKSSRRDAIQEMVQITRAASHARGNDADVFEKLG